LLGLTAREVVGRETEFGEINRTVLKTWTEIAPPAHEHDAVHWQKIEQLSSAQSSSCWSVFKTFSCGFFAAWPAASAHGRSERKMTRKHNIAEIIRMYEFRKIFKKQA
jgi:hypothetical protein